MIARKLPSLLFAALAACSPEPQAGTQTNWLSSCETDADCGKAGTCVCGKCSLECDDGSECLALSGHCAQGSTAALQCGEQSGGLCLAPCTGDGGCSAGEACVDGSCVTQRAPSKCPESPDILACAHFDAGLDEGWEAIMDSGSSVEPTESPVVLGSGALTCEGPGRAIASHALTPITSGSLYGRMWLRVDSDAAALRLHGPQLMASNLTPALRLVVDGNGAWLEGINGQLAGSTQPFAHGQWHCWRFALTVSDTEGTVEAWLDEARMASLQGLDTLPDVGISALTVGTQWTSAPVTLRADSVLLSTQPVGCVDP